MDKASAVVTDTRPISIQDQGTLTRLLADAGTIAIEMRENVTVDTKTGPEDLVTSADQALSGLLLTKLAELFPDDQCLSEEGVWELLMAIRRRWFIDPIDGTKEYVKRTGRWSVMIGLVEGDNPLFGCLRIPERQLTYFGGPAVGAWRIVADKDPAPINPLSALDTSQPIRLLVSKNDVTANPWVAALPGIQLQVASSIGLDLSEIIEGQSDVFVHIRPTLKVWDTAAPSAVALACGLEIGTEHASFIPFTGGEPLHQSCIVIGRAGAVSWWQSVFAARPQL